MGNCCDRGFFGENNFIWIILLLLLFCNDGIGGIGRDNCGCERGENNWIWILLLLFFFCCNNNDRCC